MRRCPSSSRCSATSSPNESRSESNQRQSRPAGWPKAPVRLRSVPADRVVSRLAPGGRGEDRGQGCYQARPRSVNSEYPRGVRYSPQGSLRIGRRHFGADDRSLAALSARLVFNLVQTAGTDVRIGKRSLEGRLQRELPSARLRRESGGVTPTAQMTQAVGRKRAEVQGSAPAVMWGGRPRAQILLSALDPATGADTAAAPGLTDPPVAAAVNFRRAA
jgi:hypothetical protein